MKKIATTILAAGLALSLVGCSTGTGVSEQQAYYDKYFESEDFGYAGNSISAKADGYETTVIRAQDGTRALEMIVGDASYKLYSDAEGEQYAHVVIPKTEDSEAVDTWYHYLPEASEEYEDDIIGAMIEGLDENYYGINPEAIIDIEYLETDKNGFDQVAITMKNQNYLADMVENIYNVKFTFNDQECTASLYYSELNGEISYSIDKMDAPEEFSYADYDIDFELNKFIPYEENGRTIDFEVVSIEEVETPEFVEATLAIDAETHKIVTITHIYDGVSSVVEFSKPASCMEDVVIPETVQDDDGEEMSSMLLTVALTAIESAE